MAEYTPTRDATKLGGGEARSYARLLIEELKPQIDVAYRTEPGPATTAVGGSSLGGLVSLFLGFEYPKVFGSIAVLSPSIWWNNRSPSSTFVAARETPSRNLRIWLDIGTAEGSAPRPRHRPPAGAPPHEMQGLGSGNTSTSSYHEASRNASSHRRRLGGPL